MVVVHVSHCNGLSNKHHPFSILVYMHSSLFFLILFIGSVAVYTNHARYGDPREDQQQSFRFKGQLGGGFGESEQEMSLLIEAPASHSTLSYTYYFPLSHSSLS